MDYLFDNLSYKYKIYVYYKKNVKKIKKYKKHILF